MAEILRGMAVRYPVTAPMEMPADEALADIHYARGFQEGKSMGEQEGRAMAGNTFCTALSRLEDLVASIAGALGQARLALEEDIASLATILLTPILADILTDRDFLRARIQSLLETLNSRETIRLCLHPEDLAFIREHLSHPQTLSISWLADPTLRLGGCRIQGNHGEFNLDMEYLIDRLKVMMLRIREERCHG